MVYICHGLIETVRLSHQFWKDMYPKSFYLRGAREGTKIANRVHGNLFSLIVDVFLEENIHVLLLKLKIN